jgi:uncharacterized surface protein with fasciclin (FAS1) repeats
LKDEQIKTIESKYEGMLVIKDELIKNLKELSHKKIKESYDFLTEMMDEYNEQLKKENDEFQTSINELEESRKQLNEQLSEANNQNEALKKEIDKLTISDNEKESLTLFATGSSSFLGRLKGTLDDLQVIENDLEKRSRSMSEDQYKLMLRESEKRLEEELKALVEKEKIDRELPSDAQDT